ncbi:hypothetical protein V8G54_008553 [Vigna mungo]|uniref:Uncharacterized protein n=1 Tax=Vigna mungo TaxID=3915 RepID=A0AAQ3P5E9_VIGMU
MMQFLVYLQFIDGYHRTSSFEQTYRCYSASFIEKPEIENGDKIIMPASALDHLAFLRIDYPMMFELTNGASERVSHCGVLDLETTLRKFSCLTTGDTIMVTYNNKRYYLDIIETKPAKAISIIETDCEVDFAPSLDYKDLGKPNIADKTQNKGKFNPFFGTARRLDGKPIPAVYSSGHKNKHVPNVNALSSTTSPSGGKLVFGSNFYRTKETGKEEMEPKREQTQQMQPKFQPFIGKKYSLRG